MQISTTPQNTIAFSGARLHLTVYSGIIALSDLALGNPSQQFDDVPVALPTRPQLLRGDAFPELLNSAVIAGDASFFNPEQRVICDVIERDKLNVDDEKVIRFLNREVAWARCNDKDMFDNKRPAWNLIIETLHDDDSFRKLIAKKLYCRADLTLEQQRLLCSKRASVSTICEYIKEYRQATRNRDMAQIPHNMQNQITVPA